jgi:hypothetical protein
VDAAFQNHRLFTAAMAPYFHGFQNFQWRGHSNPSSLFLTRASRGHRPFGTRRIGRTRCPVKHASYQTSSRREIGPMPFEIQHLQATPACNLLRALYKFVYKLDGMNLSERFGPTSLGPFFGRKRNHLNILALVRESAILWQLRCLVAPRMIMLSNGAHAGPRRRQSLFGKSRGRFRASLNQILIGVGE